MACAGGGRVPRRLGRRAASTRAGCRWHTGDFAALLALQADVVAVDIPIGLPAGAARRLADVEARPLLGAQRSSVFFVPPRVVLEAGSPAGGHAAVPRRRLGRREHPDLPHPGQGRRGRRPRPRRCARRRRGPPRGLVPPARRPAAAAQAHRSPAGSPGWTSCAAGCPTSSCPSPCPGAPSPTTASTPSPAPGPPPAGLAARPRSSATRSTPSASPCASSSDPAPEPRRSSPRTPRHAPAPRTTGRSSSRGRAGRAPRPDDLRLEVPRHARDRPTRRRSPQGWGDGTAGREPVWPTAAVEGAGRGGRTVVKGRRASLRAGPIHRPAAAAAVQGPTAAAT